MVSRLGSGLSVVFSALWMVTMGACSSDPDPAPEPDAGPGLDAGDEHDGGTDGAVDPDGGTDDDPCSIEALAEPAADTTYYVAIGEAGADNEDCDGLSPTDEGGGRCPFRDLSSDRTQHLLDGVASVRVELRAGTYIVSGWTGLIVNGTGRSEDERIVLTSYRGEEVVLDVPAPDGEGCTAEDAPEQPQCVREVVMQQGQYTTIQGLTLHNGLGYHAEINGGGHHEFRCNHLEETVEFAQRSDMLKIDGEATGVHVAHNEFTNWRSQAIDMTDAHEVLIEQNEFHHPHDQDGGAIGCKWGSADVVVRNNLVHDVCAGPQGVIFNLGGTGSPHPDDHEAYRVEIVGNEVWASGCKVAQIVSCLDCAFEDNDVQDVGAGLVLSASATGSDECTDAAGGCIASTGARLRGNRYRNLNGGGDDGSANVFAGSEPGEAEGLLSEQNIYCVEILGDARFLWNGELVTLSAWRTGTGTDDSSEEVLASDPRCL